MQTQYKKSPGRPKSQKPGRPLSDFRFTFLDTSRKPYRTRSLGLSLELANLLHKTYKDAMEGFILQGSELKEALEEVWSEFKPGYKEEYSTMIIDFYLVSFDSLIPVSDWEALLSKGEGDIFINTHMYQAMMTGNLNGTNAGRKLMKRVKETT